MTFFERMKSWFGRAQDDEALRQRKIEKAQREANVARERARVDGQNNVPGGG